MGKRRAWDCTPTFSPALAGSTLVPLLSHYISLLSDSTEQQLFSLPLWRNSITSLSSFSQSLLSHICRQPSFHLADPFSASLKSFKFISLVLPYAVIIPSYLSFSLSPSSNIIPSHHYSIQDMRPCFNWHHCVLLGELSYQDMCYLE